MGRNQRRRAGQRDHARSGFGGAMPDALPNESLTPDRTIRDLESLLPSFARWYGARGVNMNVATVLERLIVFYKLHAEYSGCPKATTLDTELLAELVPALLERNPDVCTSFCIALHEFVRFLGAFGKWSGSEDSYWAALDILRDAILDGLAMTPSSLSAAHGYALEGRR